MKGMKIGIDFGSSSIKIFAENKGIVINEPSIAAVSVDTRQPIAFGKAADDMLGRCGEEIEIVKVIQNGVISDFVLAEKMLRGSVRHRRQDHGIGKHHRSGGKPNQTVRNRR